MSEATDQNQNEQFEDENDQYFQEDEYVEVEIPNDIEITSNHATIIAVNNFINKPENEEFA